MCTENNKKLENYFKNIILKIAIKHVENKPNNVRFIGYLPLYKKMSNGISLDDEIPTNIRGTLIETANDSIIMFVNNRYSIKLCYIYVLNIVEVDNFIQITAVKDVSIADMMLVKKGFDKLENGCYFIDQDFIKKHNISHTDNDKQ